MSSQDQVSNTSLGAQERHCREYAKREGIEVLACFVDEGESAKTTDRPEFQKALRFCSEKRNRVGYFIVYKIDRFARNQDDHVVTQILLRKYDTRLRSVTEHIDETPIGKAMEGVLAVFAEFDNNVRSSRSREGMLEQTKKGCWVWSAPIGYKRLLKGGGLVPDEASAPYIELAFKEWKKGTYSYKSLAKFLSDRGFKTRTGKKPCPQLMEKILKNPIYCGIIRALGVEVKGQFSPIIAQELFFECQTGSKRSFSTSKRESTSSSFPLRRFVMCPECLTGLTGSFSTGNGGKYAYYHHQKQGCRYASYISKDVLEQNFVEYLQTISPKKKYEKVFKAVVRDVWQSNYKKLDGENVTIRREIQNLEMERQRVFDLHRIGKYSDIEFLEQKDLVNMMIQEKKLLLEDKRVEEFNMDEALDYCFRFVRDSAKTWQELETLPTHRARFQKQVFPEKIDFDGKKFGTNKLSLVYSLNKQNGADESQLAASTGFEPVFHG